MSPTDTIPKPIPQPSSNRWPWLWLIYTGFLFLNPILEPSVARWAGTLAVFTAFLAIFAICVRAKDHSRAARYSLIATAFVLGLITFPWNAGGDTFFIYAAAFLPFSFRSTRVVLGLFAVEAAAILAESAIFHHHGSIFYISWQNVLIAIFLLFMIGGGNIFFAAQRRAECALREAQEENFALAAVAERERIARDLHDVLGHTLSVIVLKAELAKRLLANGDASDPERAAQEIADVEKTARTALSEVREAILGYRSEGLAAELEKARTILHTAGVELDCDCALPCLNATKETVLALALREAVTNIVRHANATHCRISFTEAHGFHILRVEDNGPYPIQREGNGLRGMRERVQSLGGRLSILVESGLTLLIELPVLATQPGMHP